jgi:hypothetical protein
MCDSPKATANSTRRTGLAQKSNRISLRAPGPDSWLNPELGLGGRRFAFSDITKVSCRGATGNPSDYQWSDKLAAAVARDSAGGGGGRHVNVATESDGIARQILIRAADDQGRAFRAMAVEIIRIGDGIAEQSVTRLHARSCLARASFPWKASLQAW